VRFYVAILSIIELVAEIVFIDHRIPIVWYVRRGKRWSRKGAREKREEAKYRKREKEKEYH